MNVYILVNSHTWSSLLNTKVSFDRLYLETLVHDNVCDSWTLICLWSSRVHLIWFFTSCQTSLLAVQMEDLWPSNTWKQSRYLVCSAYDLLLDIALLSMFLCLRHSRCQWRCVFMLSICPGCCFTIDGSINFHQTFIDSAFWAKDELIRFWGQKVKGQGHSMTRSCLCFFVISLVCINGFSPYFCRYCILGRRWTD